jgi:imidazolonepropionase-like amidohydrolase
VNAATIAERGPRAKVPALIRREAAGEPTAMPADRWHIHAAPLLADGTPADWWVADGRLTTTPQENATDLPGAYVTPGLVDAHVHLTFEPRARLGLPSGTEQLVAAQLEEHAQRGVLTVRDAGSLPGIERTQLERDGLIGCGPFLAPPGFFIPHLYEGTPAAEAAQAAAHRVRSGWRWVKVIADYPGADGNPLNPRMGYEKSVIEEIAHATREAGGRLAMHVMGRFASEAVTTGIDSLEHGNWADEDAVHAMAERNVAWTPTMTTVLGHVEPVAPRFPPAQELLDRMRTTLPLAAELGVTLLAGTDEEPPGSVAHEVEALVRYGVPRAQATAAATTSAHAFLETARAAPLAEGAPANLVTFADDPATTPDTLATPAAVIRAGTRIR